MISFVHILLHLLEVTVIYVVAIAKGCPINIDLDISLFCLLRLEVETEVG